MKLRDQLMAGMRLGIRLILCVLLAISLLAMIMFGMGRGGEAYAQMAFFVAIALSFTLMVIGMVDRLGRK